MYTYNIELCIDSRLFTQEIPNSEATVPVLGSRLCAVGASCVAPHFFWDPRDEDSFQDHVYVNIYNHVYVYIYIYILYIYIYCVYIYIIFICLFVCLFIYVLIDLFINQPSGI